MSKVKFYKSTTIGAPELTRDAGSLKSLLDAVLVSGFGVKSVDSIVVSNGIATVNISGGHSAYVDCIMSISGASNASLNGEFRVISVSSSSFTFSTSAPNGTYTTGIQAKVAPLGFEKVFSSQNKSAYRSSDVSSTRLFLRLDDDYVGYARISGYEVMADIDSGSGMFPSLEQYANGIYWKKNSSSSSSDKSRWFIIGDGKSFYLCVSHIVNNDYLNIYYFGDFDSMKSNDAYSCALFGSDNSSPSSYEAAEGHMAYSDYYNNSSTMCCPRAFHGNGQGIFLTKAFSSLYQRAGYYSGLAPFDSQVPNPCDGSIPTSKFSLMESKSYVHRGFLRGIYGVGGRIQNGYIQCGDVLDAQGMLANRKLLAISSSTISVTGNFTVFFDITGDW